DHIRRLHRMLSDVEAIHDPRCSHRHTSTSDDLLGKILVHRESGGKNTGMGVGKLQIFEHTLDATILAKRTMQRVESDIWTKLSQNLTDIATDINTRNLEALGLQSIGTSRT